MLSAEVHNLFEDFATVTSSLVDDVDVENEDIVTLLEQFMPRYAAQAVVSGFEYFEFIHSNKG